MLGEGVGSAPAVINVKGTATTSTAAGFPALDRVEVYLGATLVSSNARVGTTANFSATLPDVPVGVHDIRVRAYALDGSHAEDIRRVRVLAADDDDRLRITEPVEGAQIQGPSSVLFEVGGVAGRWDQLAEVKVQGTGPSGWYFDGSIFPGGLRNSMSVDLPRAAGPWSVQATAKTQQGGQRYSQKVGFNIYERSIAIWDSNAFRSVPTPGNPLMMSADAKDCTGCIAAVEFLNGETVLARVNAPPYNFNLASLPVGTYSITARMLPVDASRGTLTSAAVSVTVVANAVPTVALTSPAAGAVLDPYQTVTLAATASDADGTVAKVDFYSGEQLLASRTTAPYTYRWALGAAGEYVFSARATDNRGAVGTSAAVRLRVGGDPVDPNPRETITYIHPDVSGSPLVATNANGNVVWKENYRGYGQRQLRQPGSEGQGQWFHGKEADATGLQYFGARYYDPVVGRFMGVDPVGFQEDNLHSFNRYAYGNNNPVRYLDPDGRQSMDVVYNVWNRVFNINRMDVPADGAPGFEIAKQGAIQGAKEGAILAAQVGLTVGTLGLGAEVALASGATKGVTNPAVAKLAAPAIPEAMTQAQFGKNLIGWGVGPQGAAARTQALTADAVGQMQAQGLTRGMATQWRSFYANEFARNANNLTAQNRVQLMDKILGLIK